MDRQQRLLEIYRTDTDDVITERVQWRFLLNGILSPAVSGEEPGWVLWAERHGNFVSDWWKPAGSDALTV